MIAAALLIVIRIVDQVHDLAGAPTRVARATPTSETRRQPRGLAAGERHAKQIDRAGERAIEHDVAAFHERRVRAAGGAVVRELRGVRDVGAVPRDAVRVRSWRHGRARRRWWRLARRDARRSRRPAAIATANHALPPAAYCAQRGTPRRAGAAFGSSAASSASIDGQRSCARSARGRARGRARRARLGDARPARDATDARTHARRIQLRRSTRIRERPHAGERLPQRDAERELIARRRRPRRRTRSRPLACTPACRRSSSSPDSASGLADSRDSRVSRRRQRAMRARRPEVRDPHARRRS